MAAVIAPQHQPTPQPAAPRRPALRVLDGGRQAGDPWIPAPRSAPARAPRHDPRRLPARVYRQRRIAAGVATVVVLAVLGLAAVGAAAVVGSATEGSPAPAPAAATPAAAAAEQVWVVQPGDTLWSIAEELQPSGDVRSLVDALADRAGGAALQAGQRIPLDGLVS